MTWTGTSERRERQQKEQVALPIPLSGFVIFIRRRVPQLGQLHVVVIWFSFMIVLWSSTANRTRLFPFGTTLSMAGSTSGCGEVTDSLALPAARARASMAGV